MLGGAEESWGGRLQDTPRKGLPAVGRAWHSSRHSPCLDWGRTLETVGDVDVVTMDTERASLGAGAGGEAGSGLLAKPPPSLAFSFPGPLRVGVLDLVP